MPKPMSEQPENQVISNPDLEKRTRRRLSPEYKMRILAEAKESEKSPCLAAQGMGLPS